MVSWCSRDPDYLQWMHRLIWSLADHIHHKVIFYLERLIFCVDNGKLQQGIICLQLINMYIRWVSDFFFFFFFSEKIRLTISCESPDEKWFTKTANWYFTSFSTLFKSYQDDGWVIMKGCAKGHCIVIGWILPPVGFKPWSLWPDGRSPNHSATWRLQFKWNGKSYFLWKIIIKIA